MLYYYKLYSHTRISGPLGGRAGFRGTGAGAGRPGSGAGADRPGSAYYVIRCTGTVHVCTIYVILSSAIYVIIIIILLF